MKKTLFFIFFMVLNLYSAPNNDSKDLNSKDNKYFKNKKKRYRIEFKSKTQMITM